MRIVFDTNVLISAAISTGNVYKLYHSSLLAHEIVTSEYIKEEFESVLLDKFHYSKVNTEIISEIMFRKLEFVDPVLIGDVALDDPTDLPIIGTAVAGKCKMIVTGDKGLYRLK
ncbi:MAG: putative toxin-antitoxin system toxin component, PIN family [Bacteroidota bacterium]|nr:putative toxin-antitoxin system toxin component, PIN family [Bacteroidota bacterium]